MECDVLLIGAGQANVPLARKLSEAGKSVVLAERGALGGSCVNFGCTPTKAALASAHFAARARKADELGVRLPKVTVDFPAVIERAFSIAEESRQSLEKMFAKHNIPILRDHARLTGTDGDRITADVNGTKVTAKDVILDTGTRSTMPKMDGLDGVKVITSENWLSVKDHPGPIALIGGGYIGCEMSQFYVRCECPVTIYQSGETILPNEDKDVAEAIQEALRDDGVTIKLNTKLTRVPDDVKAVFVSIGRTPNTDDLGLNTIGLATNDKGYIDVDEHCRTKVDGVWAVGDIRGGPAFTHTSYDDGHAVAAAMGLGPAHTTDRPLIYGVFTNPPLGRFGLTEADARKRGEVRVAKIDMQKAGRAREDGNRRGFIKLVVAAKTGEILGAACFGENGPEIVHLLAVACWGGMTVDQLKNRMFIHPTYAEAVQIAIDSI